MSTTGVTLTIYADAAGTTPANPQDVYNAFTSGLVLLAAVGSDVVACESDNDGPDGGVSVATDMKYYGTPSSVTKVVLYLTGANAVAGE